ncbi:hypothetical protein [Stenotrophomonas oahuensis]|uniref:Type II secretion system protein GspC N-terminal domain-containing protein n=1 Tax=Stenotrophomonas oahuensis TaxID=3003271 RepID=A0ABY9YUY3_9GAMM|nr:hypothetical protein [Stenotrophomonas sp. A5586]WNH54799.1 hypothetical protein PDM29_20865 [Stenotrophomonas sp. A5586]
MKLLQSSVIQMALAGGGLALIWSGLDTVTENIKALPVLQVEHVADQGAEAAVPEIFPVWVAPRAAAVTSSADGLVDSAFSAVPAPAEEQAPAEPLYGEALAASARVQGTSGNGAFINERFYAAGDEIAALAVPSADGVTLVPRLVSAGRDQVVMLIAGQQVVVRKGDAGWQ